jgi:hypothetical protein
MVLEVVLRGGGGWDDLATAVAAVCRPLAGGHVCALNHREELPDVIRLPAALASPQVTAVVISWVLVLTWLQAVLLSHVVTCPS